MPRSVGGTHGGTVYFITARVRDPLSAFASDDAKAIFWLQFNRYTAEHGFTPWVTSLLDNHYHTLGYLREGDQLPHMMRLLHGSVAKLVNDLLEQHPGVTTSAGMSSHPTPASPHPSGATRATRITSTAASATATATKADAPTATSSRSADATAFVAICATIRTRASTWRSRHAAACGLQPTWRASPNTTQRRVSPRGVASLVRAVASLSRLTPRPCR